MDKYEAESIKQRRTAELLQLEGVCGLSLRNDDGGDPVLVLFLDKHTDITGLPKAVDGLRVAYEHTGVFKAQS